MFGRRRHVAVVPAAPLPVPQLTDAQILELVQAKMAEFIGVEGEWSVVRRSAGDTDTLFQSILVQSVSVGIASAITDARRRLEEGEPVSEPQHLAGSTTITAVSPAAAEPASTAETAPAAFSWEPSPITVWTDLRKPVSGTVEPVEERTAA